MSCYRGLRRSPLFGLPEEILLEICSQLFKTVAPQTCVQLNRELESGPFEPALAQVPDIRRLVLDALYSAATGCVKKAQVRGALSPNRRLPLTPRVARHTDMKFGIDGEMFAP